MATISEHCANVEADAGAALLDDGYLRLFDEKDVLLAECRFSLPAFEMASSGMAKARKIFPDLDTRGQGKPSIYRAYMADGRTLVQEGNVGTKGADMTLPSPLIVPHAEFFVTEFWYIRRRS